MSIATGHKENPWSPSREKYSHEEIIESIKQLQCVFDAVRMVDPRTGTQLGLSDEGRLVEDTHRCWSVWNKPSRCAHCISRCALVQKERMSKFEFVGDDLYHVFAKYVLVDGHPYSLEMISKVPDETILEGRGGRRDIVEAISKHNRRVYTDPLTGVYNRRYLEEMFQGIERGRAVAIIDADNFKRVNDTYGHAMGDQVLKRLAQTIASCVRSMDAVVRYGGDEFVVVFEGMPANRMGDKLEQIRQQMLDIVMEEVPSYRQTVSIGGAFGDGCLQELIERADKMLYRAKEDGRNCVRLQIDAEE